MTPGEMVACVDGTPVRTVAEAAAQVRMVSTEEMNAAWLERDHPIPIEHRPPEIWEDIDRYAKWTQNTWATGEEFFWDVAICALGLAGETGEAIEVVKKSMRDGLLDHGKLVAELGDVIYYWARLCDLFEIRPGMVMKRNVEKLTSRMERGVIHGAGDDR